jgi:hypothetical protein
MCVGNGSCIRSECPSDGGRFVFYARLLEPLVAGGARGGSAFGSGDGDRDGCASASATAAVFGVRGRLRGGEEERGGCHLMRRLWEALTEFLVVSEKEGRLLVGADDVRRLLASVWRAI